MSGRRERVRRGGFASAGAARSAGRELLTAEVDGPLSAGRTVGQWLWYWLSVVEARLRPTTHRGYRDNVRLHLIPFLGRVRLAELSRRDVTRMFVALGRRRNAAPAAGGAVVTDQPDLHPGERSAGAAELSHPALPQAGGGFGVINVVEAELAKLDTRGRRPFRPA
ncbi:hypothetical protein [Nonomuraea insulae]|uniref:Integrase SAM-like N-terminal domain-containing protein n=1 Tax=Nonomuraea insulae TaxID=1616787 RepID=A0ABW1CT18_9ACTN